MYWILDVLMCIWSDDVHFVGYNSLVSFPYLQMKNASPNYSNDSSENATLHNDTVSRH